MRRITASTFVSLDGVMQVPGGKEEDTEGGFDHGGWSVGYFDDVVGQAMGEYMTPPFDLLIGRKTYEIFAGYWPGAAEGDDAEIAKPLNDATKYVVSTTLTSVDWEPGVLINGDVVTEIKQLKAGDGPDIQVHGSSVLLQTLHANNLIDWHQLVISPVVIGTGKRLFGDGTVPAGLRLVDAKIAPSGVIIARYEPDGAIKYGQMGN